MKTLVSTKTVERKEIVDAVDLGCVMVYKAGTAVPSPTIGTGADGARCYAVRFSRTVDGPVEAKLLTCPGTRPRGCGRSLVAAMEKKGWHRVGEDYLAADDVATVGCELEVPADRPEGYGRSVGGASVGVLVRRAYLHKCPAAEREGKPEGWLFGARAVGAYVALSYSFGTDLAACLAEIMATPLTVRA